MTEKTPQQEYDEMFSRLQTDDKYAAAMAYVMKQDFLSYMVTMFYLINCQRMMLKDFHLTVIKKLQGLVDGTNEKRNLALCLPVGCLSGDTVIRYNRATLGRKMTIKDMYLKQNNLPNTRKWNLKIPTFVRSFIEKDNQIRLNKVNCITYSGKKMVYELLLEDGKSVKATIEHKIMTDKGFVELGKLKVGDFVMVDNVVGKKKKEVSEATKKKAKEKTKCVGKYHPYSKTCDDYSWRVELHRAIYEAHLNNMSLEDFCLACKSPNNLKFINPKTHHIHHIDGNHSNNAIENLQCLTREEHLKVHGNYNHFGYGKPEYSAVKSVTQIGIEDTYDITCFDNQNFNANDIIVHNSGKSLLTEYFISWCFARSRDNAFVYTSHSEDLITKMSAEIRSICTFPMWQRLFGWVLKKDDRQKTNFSFEGAKNRTGLRAKAIGSAITGLDASSPAVDGFSGALIIDDPMDAGNAIYEIERENIVRIYKEKLATRRRTPKCPTILIMQRLHPEDLVGWAEKNEPELWDIVKVKALNDDGTSFWEERYPASELEMLQKRQGALFQAQYQQEPVITGGSVIKTEWFKYYQQHPKYERIFMTSDTAMKANEWNDYSVLQLWGKYQNSLYLIDMIRGKWEVPDLIQKTRDFVKKYRLWENRILLSALYVEDRGSGVGLIQQLRRETSVPILPLKPNKKDKVTRAKEIAYYIESGMVFLPQDKDYSFNREFLTEIELFSANGQNKHDDQCFDGLTLVATLRGDIPIKDVKIGDYVITPFGLKKVLNCGITGYKETINKFGLEVTPDHKIFANGTFDRIDKLVYNCNIDRLTYRGLLKWMYQKVLFSMESNLTLSGREGIISVRQQQMLHEKILKDFMLRCGNFIMEGKFLKGMLFIIKTITHLIMTSLIWNVYLLQNIMKFTDKEEVNMEKAKNNLNILKKLENLQKNGTQVKKEKNGIGNILKKKWIRKDILKSVPNVDKNLKLAEQAQYVKNVEINYFNENCEINDMEQYLDKYSNEFALYVEQNLKQRSQEKNIVAKSVPRPVYNLTIQDVGCFYANGILVSNCDAMVYAIQIGLANSGVSIFDS